ncbi:MAG: ABC transporter substrate-binding protein [Synergistaceae bacterium]|nr:ABC transporter substrate-binding protein [Synergistaceae bacterium]
MRKVLLVLLALSLAASAAFADATSYPVTINNGNRKVVFEKAPERVVTNCDSNIIELMFALGLESKLAGYAGFVEEGCNVSPEYQEKLKAIPMTAPGYITLEVLLGANPDFFLSGYNYGLNIPGDTTGDAITPEELEKHGIKSYAITESLIRVMKKPVVSLNDTYNDLKNLGIIFDVQDKAEQVINDMKFRVASVESKIKDVKGDKPISVFIYQTWNAPDQPPRTVGAQAMPSAILSMAGAKNIFSDVDNSYISSSWEEVVARDPEVILLLECGNANGEERAQILRGNPILQGVKAIKDNKIIVIRVEEFYPGPRAVHGLEALAKALYNL